MHQGGLHFESKESLCAGKPIRLDVTNYYIYGLGLLYEITETATNSYARYYHYDYRGSTVALTDSAGNVTDRIEYSAYGMLTYRAGSTDTPFLFNGRYGVQTDPNGLLYMRARYYNPYICRFINPDPIGFAGGLNWYAYADGNPVSYLDPFGLCGVSEGFWSWVENLAWAAANAVLKPTPFGQVASGLQTTWGLWNKYGQSGYAADNGVWNTSLMIVGEFAGTTPFAEGWYGVDIGYGIPLTKTESVERLLGGGITMAGWVVGGYAAAGGVSHGSGNTAPIRWGPLNGPGPLGEAVASTFRGGSYTELITSEPTTLYRVYGGRASQLGHYWTRMPPSGPLQARIDYALDPSWGNTANNVVRIQIPAGTRIYEGYAAPQGGLVGGGSQVYILKVDPRWIVNP